MHSGNKAREIIKLLRSCPAILIPDGNRVQLESGTEVVIQQALGGSYTVTTELGYMARIDGKDADALGKCTEQEQGKKVAATPQELERFIWDEMRKCYDPEIPVNIVDLGLIYACNVYKLEPNGFRVEVRLTLTAPGCGMGGVLADDVKNRVTNIGGVKETDVQIVFEPPWDRSMMSEAARLELGLM